VIFDNTLINQKLFSKALNKSNLKNFIKQNKSGIEFRVGDKGSKISGGQKQRLLIARSFYHDREIIIFDESTSALDAKMENKIFNDLKKLKGTFTGIFISHNKNILQFCNKVYELKNKKINLIKNEKQKN
jgi:ATP-binding cassette subfamily C protein